MFLDPFVDQRLRADSTMGPVYFYTGGAALPLVEFRLLDWRYVI